MAYDAAYCYRCGVVCICASHNRDPYKTDEPIVWVYGLGWTQETVDPPGRDNFDGKSPSGLL